MLIAGNLKEIIFISVHKGQESRQKFLEAHALKPPPNTNSEGKPATIIHTLLIRQKVSPPMSVCLSQISSMFPPLPV